MVLLCPIGHTAGEDTAPFILSSRRGEEHTMPTFFFSVKVTPAAETEFEEVAAPDLFMAVQILAAWRPGIHIVRLEGVHEGAVGYA